MSACDTCLAPRRCCTGLVLGRGTFPAAEHPLFALAEIASYMSSTLHDGIPTDMSLPWLPLWREQSSDTNEYVWRLWCPELTSDGRCGIYETRPYACRHYKPGTDRLCVMHGLIEEPVYAKT